MSDLKLSDLLNSLFNRTIIFFVLTRINSKLFTGDLRICFFLNIHAVKALCYLLFHAKVKIKSILFSAIQPSWLSIHLIYQQMEGIPIREKLRTWCHRSGRSHHRLLCSVDFEIILSVNNSF